LPLRFHCWIVALALAAAGCGGERDPLILAAAANLDRALPQLAERFEAVSGIATTLSFGSTANLARQIENGAPFDLYLAADTEHVDQLVAKGLVAAGDRKIYARGRLVLWSAQGQTAVDSLAGLLDARVRFVAIANPSFAPYGLAAEQALRSAGVLERIQPKIVYAQDVRMAKQFAASGNAEAALIAASIVVPGEGRASEVDPSRYEPIEQAAGAIASSPRRQDALKFLEFLLGADGQAILARQGYSAP
jgi:molybdate transport system substrate-binding protein